MKLYLLSLLFAFTSEVFSYDSPASMTRQNSIPGPPGPPEQRDALSNLKSVLHTRNFFYVGGSYFAVNGSEDNVVAAHQMYVEHLVPAKVSQKYPIVMIHGNGEAFSFLTTHQWTDFCAGMTGTNFLNTPDGRVGWADYFMSKGFELYIVDQPARARSAWQQAVDGPQSTFSALTIEQRFTATELFNLWPKAHLHTQWPGNGSQGDPTFDSFYASTMPSLVSSVEASVRVQAAAVELLDKIGPVIVLTHSQSGQYGWALGDARPALVKAIVALEPIGPPFINAIFPPLSAARPFGLTEIPVQFTPPIQGASELATIVVASESEANSTCIQQASPARKLTNLAHIPVMVATSASGYHTVYDDCSVGFLRQGGVSVKHVHLEDEGIFGNGHMMFMEKNNLQIADQVVNAWVQQIL